jgi:predicted permease
VRHVLAESLLLALLGGIAGVLIALLTLQLLPMLEVVGLPRLEQAELDSAVLLFATASSLFTALLFGALPAGRAASTADITGALKSSGGAITADRAGGRTRAALIIAEVALAVLLLAGAGLLLKSFVELQRVDPGFNPSGVLTFNMPLPSARYAEPQQSRAFFAELNRRIEALPGVEATASVFGLPLSGFSYIITVETLDGVPAYDSPGNERLTQVRVVTPQYFNVMQIPLRAGRELSDRDRADTQPVVVVNESAAELLWPGANPLGRTFELGTTLGAGGGSAGGTVVGVVADIKHNGLGSETQPEVFFAHDQFPVDTISMTVRTSVPPESLIAPIREQVREMDSELPLDRVVTLEQSLSESVAQPRFYTLLLGIFAAVALVLAAIGIYGVMTYSVRNRTSEIGVRLALGAESNDVLGMVLTQAMKLALGGLILGLFAAFLLTRVLSGLLYGVSATDPVTFFGVAMLLATVALLASYIPARRATRVDPMTALREE